jgi:hypothetical protein
MNARLVMRIGRRRKACCLDGGIDARVAGVLELLGEFHDEDRVFYSRDRRAPRDPPA